MTITMTMTWHAALLAAPIAPTETKILKEHDDVRHDAYYWLRDDERKSPQVLQHLEAENAYTAAVMADTEALQETLYLENRARIQEADQSATLRKHGYYYYTRTAEGQQYQVHCRRRVPPGAGPRAGD